MLRKGGASDRLLDRALRLARRSRADQRGVIAIMFALLAPVLMLCMIGAIDLTSIQETKQRLQDSTDSAALAVSATAAKNPNTSETTLRSIALGYLQANFVNGAPSITAFSVCTPVQTTDCPTVNGQTNVTNSVSMTTSVSAPCWLPFVMPGVCNSNEQSMPMYASNTTNIGFAANVQINVLMDVSGSMIVGSTASDVTKVENWNNVAANWATVHYSGDSSQSTPCAFACHDQGPSSSGVNGPTTSGSATSDMQMGETNAHSAGATTRLDVMLSSVGQTITAEQGDITNSPQLAKNSYYFNIYTIADTVNNIYTATTADDWTDPVKALNNVYVGLDTHLNEQLPNFASTIGVNGSGNTKATPLKFVVLVTDGLESDFYSDFYSCGGYASDTAWQVPGYYGSGSVSPQWYGYYATGCFAAPMSTAACTTMKNNGVVLAVLETPYVPLTGQDPSEQYLYETFVRHTIYPNGPNSSSTVSAQLSACATSPQYYYQANTTDSTAIAKGLAQLINTFLASTAYIKQ